MNLKIVAAVLLIVFSIAIVAIASDTYQTPKTAICIHFHYPSEWKAGDQLPQRDVDMILKAKDLNAKYIRFDLWWKDVEPDKDNFNDDAFAYYRAIIDRIHQEGMDVIVIVGSSGGFPNWTMNLLQEPAPMSEIVIDGENTKIPSKMKKEDFIKFVRKHKIPVRNVVEKNGYVILGYIPTQEFLDEAKEYASKVAQELGNKIYYYQLSNEFNHISDKINSNYDADYIKALYDGIDHYDEDYKTIVNVFADANCALTWSNQLTDLLNKAGDCIDIVAIDHYPGRWSVQSYDHWGELDTLFSIADQYNKQAAVMETGFSTYESISHTEEKQQEFINTAIPAIKEKANQHELLFVTWYELTDEPWTTPSVYPWIVEWYFGILKDDLSPKSGYNDLKYQFETIQYFVNITSPTQSNPADAGYYNSPQSIIHVVVEVKDSGNPVNSLTKDDFTFIVGSKTANDEFTELLDSSNGVYTFSILPPDQSSPGKYDLTVVVRYKDYNLKDVEKEAVEYKSCPAGEAMYRSGVSNPEGKLNVLRELRDKQLNRKYVSLYYKYSPEIRDVVISDPKLIMDMSSMIVKYLPAIKHSLREGGMDVFVTKEDVIKAISIIDRIEKGINAKKIDAVKKREIIRLLEELKGQIEKAEGKRFSKAFRDSVYFKWHRSFRIEPWW